MYTVEETSPGIYTVSGDILPIQVIDSRELSAEENLWLKSLSNELDYLRCSQVFDETMRQGKMARLAAFLDVITRANFTAMEEAKKMTKALGRMFEEAGWTAEWVAQGEAKGRAEGREEVARNALAEGASPDFISKITGLDIAAITGLSEKAIAAL